MNTHLQFVMSVMW